MAHQQDPAAFGPFTVDTASVAAAADGTLYAAAPAAKAVSRRSALRPYLAGQQPGLWASDHLEESRHFTLWTYTAVSAFRRQAQQATLHVEHVLPHDHEGAAGGAAPGRRRNKGRRRRSLKRLSPRARRVAKAAGAAPDPVKSKRRPLSDRHALVRLLNRPNPAQSFADLLGLIVMQLEVTGSALVWVVRNGAGVPVELYVLPTASATPQPPNVNYPHGSYRVSPLAAFSTPLEDDFLPPGSLGPLLTTGAVIDARDVKPIRFPHLLYLSDGWSPLAAGALMVDVAEQLYRSWWYSLKNSPHPGLVLSQDEDANPDPNELQAFREDLRNRNSGTTNVGKDLLLPPGLKADQIERSVVEMDYVNAYPYLRDGNLALHGCPPIATGISEAGSYAAFYASLKQFTDLSVQPDFSLIAAGLTRELAPDFERAYGLAEGERYEIGIKAKAIDDPSVKEARLRNDLSAKSLTINEWRAERGLPPVPWGNKQVGTQVQLDKDGNEVEQPQGPPGGLPGMPGAGGKPAGLNGAAGGNGHAPPNGNGKPAGEGRGGAADATGTGVRQRTREAVPGAPGGNGKAHANGHARNGRAAAAMPPALADRLKGAGPHRHASTQFNLPLVPVNDSVGQMVLRMAAEMPAEDVLEVEPEPHVTCLYGLGEV